MELKLVPENAENVIPYEVKKNNLDLNDGDIIINLAKRERDDATHIDFCFDPFGFLVMGTDTGMKYVAQVDIPARQYKEETVENPDFNADEEESEMNRKTITKKVAVPFDINRCTLTLWEVED